MRLDISNPVNLFHPLNYLRSSWWYNPINTAFGPFAGRKMPDLMGKYDGTMSNGASATCTWAAGTDFANGLDFTGTAGDGANCSFGNVYSYTSGFTIGAWFYTTTVAGAGPGPGSGGVIFGKNAGGGSSSWHLSRNNATIFASGSGSLVSGTITTYTPYRAVVVFNGASSALYVNGYSSATGSVTVGSDSSDCRIGYGINNWTWAFRGRVWDVFISNRVWTANDVALDYTLGVKGYEGADSPLRWIKDIYYSFPDPGDVSVSFDTAIEMDQDYSQVSVAEFSTNVFTQADAGGLGDTVPSEVADFHTHINADDNFGAGEPTLVGFDTAINIEETVDTSDPVEFDTGIQILQTQSSIANGNPRILAQKRFRR